MRLKKERVISLRKTEIVVIGGGPAGLSAAISAASMGAHVTVIEQDKHLGGQLIKQTHMFFGSANQYAATRGIDIATLLNNKCREMPNIEILLGATVLGRYNDGVIPIEKDNRVQLLHADCLIVATGASEKVLPFPNNDLPGVYGAGAVQTMMNVYGVKPAEKVLMVGAGNIGLIVSYQLLQAHVKVAAVIEGARNIGGYLVHASKIRRAGVPILTSHTIKQAYGEGKVEGAIIWQLDEKWQPIPGSERDVQVDAICLAVGLTPMSELLWQSGCQMNFVPELGGHVALRKENLETTVPGIFVAGDVSGVEEASSAMVEGKLAGVSAARKLGYTNGKAEEVYANAMNQLNELRSGPVGEKIRAGLKSAVV